MTNTDVMNQVPKGRYKLFRRENGTTGLVRDPLGNCIVVTDAAEVEVLELTPDEAEELRKQHRADKLDFSATKRAYGRGRKPEPTTPHETMERNNSL